jgi:hypothetical protein
MRVLFVMMSAMSFVCPLLAATSISEIMPKAAVSTDGFVRVVANDDPRDEMGFRRPILAFAVNEIESLSKTFGIDRVKTSAPGLVVYALDGRTNDTRVVVRAETRSDGSKVSKVFLPSPGYSDLDDLRMAIAHAFLGHDLPQWVIQGALRCRNESVRRSDIRFVLELWNSGRLPFFPALCTDLRVTKGQAAALPGYMAGWMLERKLFPELRKRNWNGKWLAEALTGETDPMLQDRASDERLVRLSRSVLEPGRCGKWDADFFSSRMMLYSSAFAAKLIDDDYSCSYRQAIAAGDSNLAVRAAALLKARELPLYALGRGERLQDTAKTYQRFLLGVAAGEDRAKLTEFLNLADAKMEAVYEENRKDDNRQR